MLLLNTRGRTSGKLHTVPLLYLHDGETLVVVASWGGRDYHPDWYLNLIAQPAATVNIGRPSTAQLEIRLEIERFHRVLNNLDVVLSEKELDIKFSKRLLQGPLSDVLCHIGQIAMLSGQSGNKIKGEDFFPPKL